MTPSQAVESSRQKMQSALEHLEAELKQFRTGRANAHMLDSVTVPAYGGQMPLNQLASISVPEPQLLQVSPFDPTNLPAIVSAIRENQNLGLNPMDDGRVVRLSIPALSEERRREIAKQLNGRVEDCLIAMRQARHDAFRQIDQAKKDKVIGENETQRYERQVDEQMAKYKSEAESLAKAKENEILTL